MRYTARQIRSVTEAESLNDNVSYRRTLGSCHTSPRQDPVHMYQTHRRWWSVAEAARVLRMHTDTIYDACASGDFPHERWDGIIKIPCEALKMTYVPDEETLEMQRRLRATAPVEFTFLDDPDQLALPLDPSCLVPARLYRNGDRKHPHAYERALWSHNKPLRGAR